MTTMPQRSPSGVSSWRRVCLHSLVILGIFAMHHLLVGHEAGHAEAAQPAGAAQVAAHAGHDTHAAMAGAPVEGDAGHEPVAAVTDCCGLAMLCLSMVMGIGVLLLVRRRAADRVLWQLPPPTRLKQALRVPPFHGLTPLQRSSVLRC